MHYYSFNIGDYTSSTQHLELLEDLAYRRMLDLYYSKESPLPESVDEIARLTRMRSHCDCITIVLQDFFELKNDGWHCKKADEEISKFHEKSHKARKSASSRWSKKQKKTITSSGNKTQCEGNANALQTQCEGNANQEPITNNQYNIKDSSSEKKFSDDDMKCAQWIFDLIKSVTNKPKKPNFDKWADTIRLIRERDGRTHREIAELFKWANNDSFWQSNILSPVTLRKQWDKLTARKLSDEKHQGNNQQSGHKLNRVEAQNQRLLEKYGYDATPGEREINPIDDTGLG